MMRPESNGAVSTAAKRTASPELSLIWEGLPGAILHRISADGRGRTPEERDDHPNVLRY